MKKIDAKNLNFDTLNELIRKTDGDIIISDCLGQRFIGSGLGSKKIQIEGTAGNALGAYLDGATITAFGNVQDAVGDTMNDGKIIVHGSAGDAVGYAMRGGEIYVQKNAGYRVGIHMKAYKSKLPVMVIGGTVGSFLGEYQAGGIIVVLNLSNEKEIVGKFCGTGMHGGKIFLRTKTEIPSLPPQVHQCKATKSDLAEIAPLIKNFCSYFGGDEKAILSDEFLVLTPNSNNPYRQLYVEN